MTLCGDFIFNVATLYTVQYKQMKRDVHFCLFQNLWGKTSIFLPKLSKSDEIRQKYRKDKKVNFYRDTLYMISALQKFLRQAVGISSTQTKSTGTILNNTEMRKNEEETIAGMHDKLKQNQETVGVIAEIYRSRTKSRVTKIS